GTGPHPRRSAARDAVQPECAGSPGPHHLQGDVEGTSQPLPHGGPAWPHPHQLSEAGARRDGECSADHGSTGPATASAATAAAPGIQADSKQFGPAKRVQRQHAATTSALYSAALRYRADQRGQAAFTGQRLWQTEPWSLYP